METILICLFIAVLLPIAAKAPVAMAQLKTGRYDNNHPREQQASLTGFGARALAAHQNSFEAIIMFAPCVLAALATNTISDAVIYSSVVFVVARIAYIALYLLNWATFRSTVWFVGLFAGLNILWQVIAGL